jgi:hypothetical protein
MHKDTVHVLGFIGLPVIFRFHFKSSSNNVVQTVQSEAKRKELVCRWVMPGSVC